MSHGGWELSRGVAFLARAEFQKDESSGMVQCGGEPWTPLGGLLWGQTLDARGVGGQR